VLGTAGLLLAVAVLAAALRTAWPTLSTEVGSATARQPLTTARDTPEPAAPAPPAASGQAPPATAPPTAAAPPADAAPAPAGSYYATAPAGATGDSHRGRDGGGGHGGPGPH